MKMPDYNKIELIASGGNYLYTIQEDGYLFIDSSAVYGGNYVFINNICFAEGREGYDSGWPDHDFNFIPVSKGNIITSNNMSGRYCQLYLYFIPFKK